MQHYLFVHFREKTSPDGEQVHFAISRDGFHWQALNGGHPVLPAVSPSGKIPCCPRRNSNNAIRMAKMPDVARFGGCFC